MPRPPPRRAGGTPRCRPRRPAAAAAARGHCGGGGWRCPPAATPLSPPPLPPWWARVADALGGSLHRRWRGGLGPPRLGRGRTGGCAWPTGAVGVRTAAVAGRAAGRHGGWAGADENTLGDCSGRSVKRAPPPAAVDAPQGGQRFRRRTVLRHPPSPPSPPPAPPAQQNTGLQYPSRRQSRVHAPAGTQAPPTSAIPRHRPGTQPPRVAAARTQPIRTPPKTPQSAARTQRV
ncbi:hypothetical protein I4F81_012793 [Pyropia yezoensis]|uniref:Uncharacterized protein n=1 Tax=Pyropia yezoensis TaxID=2788 RepID=A0ACC3CJ59_PYRYE|nr:hypothetical protein I4F81_012793 [Neopyropia yezoensis]